MKVTGGQEGRKLLGAVQRFKKGDCGKMRY